jgi:TRAP-type uncharacterized transport system substrate-binding protein
VARPGRRSSAQADLAVGPITLGHFNGDLTVEVAAQLDNEENGILDAAFFTGGAAARS